MTGFDNGILIAYGMCPPVELMQYYQMDPTTQPRHFMQGTATKVWGDDIFKIMRSSAVEWDSDDSAQTWQLLSLFSFLFSVIYFTTVQ